MSSQRIFEYMDDEGHIYWSFKRQPGRKAVRLTLQSMRGEHYRRHISDIQKEVSERMQGGTGDTE